MSSLIERDPLLQWSIDPHSDNLFIRHGHEVVFFALAFHALYLLAPLANAMIFGSWFVKEASADTRENYNVRFVGVVQALLSVMVCIPMFQHPLFKTDPIGGSYDFAALVASFTIGYFVWDLFYCCLFHYSLYGPEFLFHAFGALFVFGTTLMPFCQPYLCAFLIYEASTPFVQFHYMMTRAPKGSFPQWAITINGLFLIAIFFAVRIVWGVYATGYSIYLIWPLRENYHWALLVAVYGLNVGFQFLNFTWFSKMVSLAMRSLAPEKPSGSDDSASKERKSD